MCRSYKSRKGGEKSGWRIRSGGGEHCSGEKRNDRWVVMVARIRETTFGCDMTLDVAG